MCSINSTISFVLNEHLSHIFDGFAFGADCLRLKILNYKEKISISIKN